MRTTRIMIAAVVLVRAGATLAMAAPEPTPPVEFNRDIRPILSSRCFACHGPDAGHRKADLRLDQEAGAKRRAIVSGKPERSPLLARVAAAGATRMPPRDAGKPLSSEEVALLRRWIQQGAAYQQHWSFIPPRRAPLPAVRNRTWAGTPIDRFVLAKIEAAGLQPSPEADRITLSRRLSFDLNGLPPTPAEVDAFAGDTRPDAYEHLADRLLSSPRFGERMASYWLDLVRYADTVGYHGDQEQHIQPYRDYVIKAFNDNLPFDRFTQEQLAGDLLPGATVTQKIATGYNRLLQTTHEGGAQDKEYRAKYQADRVRNFSAVWLGATMGCAECHNHKFDPYTQKDFYSLAAFFADIDEKGAFRGPDASPTLRPPEMVVLSPFDQEEADRLERRIREAEARVPPPGEELAALRTQHAEVLKRARPTLVTASVEPRTVRILRRGSWMDEGGEIVQPAVPAFLRGPEEPGRRLKRLELARWLTRPDHPLTARVFVNRMWYLLFGSGLYRSLEDDGSQGEWPTHPELLDHLALDFVQGGWDVKRLLRAIVTTNAYRQNSLVTRMLKERDPENRLFARQARFRLPAEMIRDQALAASGLLVERLGGPSARPYQPEGYYSLLNFPKRTYQPDRDEGQYRRGVYVHWQRQYLHPMLKAFDAPMREECTAARPVTNTPLAALTLLNDPTFVEAARVLAVRVLREAPAADEERIRWAWRTVLSRAPQDREVRPLLRLCQEDRRRYQAEPAEARKLLSIGLAPVPNGADVIELAAWTGVARALLNLNETITRN